jgi:hypothetical protein
MNRHLEETRARKKIKREWRPILSEGDRKRNRYLKNGTQFNGAKGSKWVYFKYGWMRYLYPTVLFMVVVFNLCIGFRLLTQDAYNGKYAEERAILYSDMMASTALEISTNYDQIEALSTDLYYMIKEICTNSEDQVVQRLFKTQFPSDEDYSNDPYNGYITLNALLNNHPEIKADSDILDTLQDIYVAETQLDMNVDNYNMYLEYYQFWAGEYNSSIYHVTNGVIDIDKYREIEVKH